MAIPTIDAVSNGVDRVCFCLTQRSCHFVLEASPKNAYVPTRNWISARSGIAVLHTIHLRWFELDPSNPHSLLGFANHRSISRGFLHPALSNACPTGNIETFYARAAGQASNKAKRNPSFLTSLKVGYSNYYLLRLLSTSLHSHD